MYNGKIRCVISRSPCYIKGVVYSVVNGVLINQLGDKETKIYSSFNEINRHLLSQFEEVNENIMTKSDLKDGMMVKLKNGLIRDINNLDLSKYDNDLTSNIPYGSELDIMKVYKIEWSRKSYVEIKLEELKKSAEDINGQIAELQNQLS